MDKQMSLTQDIRYLKGVGPKRAKEFNSLGIHTIKDLFDYFPFRIDDFSRTKRIADLRPGDEVSVAGRVTTTVTIPGLRGPVVRVGISDGTGLCYLVWYNMPYMTSRLRRGMKVVASGKAEWRRESWEIAHPWLKREQGQTSMGQLSQYIIVRQNCLLQPYLGLLARTLRFILAWFRNCLLLTQSPDMNL